MSLDIYSTILVSGSIALFLGAAGIGVLALVSPNIRVRLAGIEYTKYLAALAAISVVSIVGSLIFQLVYETPVCELCWWQRIFLYPVSVIALVALWYRTREAHVTIGILALLGFLIASYHYYYHFQRFVLGNVLALPCSYGGLLPACTDSPILIFGFATIPLMGIMVFGSMIAVALLAHRALGLPKITNQLTNN